MMPRQTATPRKVYESLSTFQTRHTESMKWTTEKEPVTITKEFQNDVTPRSNQEGIEPLEPLPTHPILLIERDSNHVDIDSIWGDSVVPVQLTPIGNLFNSDTTLHSTDMSKSKVPKIVYQPGKPFLREDYEALRDDYGHNLFWRIYSIPCALFCNYRLLSLTLIGKSEILEASISWRIHRRIRDFYHKHIRVYDKFLKESTPFQGLGTDSWKSYFEKLNTDSDGESSSCGALIHEASIEIFTSISIDIDECDTYKNADTPPNRLKLWLDGCPPNLDSSDGIAANSNCSISKEDEESVFGSSETVTFSRSFEQIEKDVDEMLAKLHPIPAPVDNGATTKSAKLPLSWLFPSRRKKQRVNSCTDNGIDATLTREAWRVWALRRGLRPVLGVYKRQGQNEFLMVKGLRELDNPESSPGNRREMDMISFVQRSHLLYPQENHPVQGIVFKESRIKKIIAMYVLVIHALHQEGVASGNLNDLSNSIVLSFNERTKSYYPVIQKFTNGAKERKQSDRRAPPLWVQDWHGVAIATLTMFLGTGYYDMYRISGLEFIIHTYERELQRIGVSDEALKFVSLCLSHELYGFDILLDAWIDVDWSQLILGIH